jgi:acyl-CoA thioesterase-1
MCALSGCTEQEHQGSQPAPQQPLHDTEGIIVAMGDSLTAGFGVAEEEAYPAQLEQKLRAAGYPFRVINAGVSGETSSGARTRTAWTLTLKPDIVILETGANDGLRGIDTTLTQQNIETIVQTLTARKVVVVLAGMQMVRNLGEAYTTDFARMYPTVAQKHGLILFPFFLAGVAGNPTLNQSDGIHPTAEGYRIVVDNLYPHVLQAIRHLRARRTSHRDAPGHSDKGT